MFKNISDNIQNSGKYQEFFFNSRVEVLKIKVYI